MAKLSNEQLDLLVSRINVRSVAVENFLMSNPVNTSEDYLDACTGLKMDARLYKWNAATVKAIRDGLDMMRKS